MRRAGFCILIAYSLVSPLRGQVPALKDFARFDLMGDPLPQGSIARLGSVRFLHEDWVRHLAFLPGDHELLAACGRTARLWEADSGRAVRQFPRPNSIMCAAVSPDRKIVAVAENGSHVFLFEVGSGTELRVLVGDGNRSADLVWSPDGRRLAAGMGPMVIVWDTMTGKVVQRLRGADKFIVAVAIAPNGQVLAGGGRKSAQLWNVTTGEIICQLDGGLDDGVGSLAFAPDGKTLVGACSEPIGNMATRSSLRQWDAATGKKSRDLSSGTFGAVAFSKNGSMLAAASSQEIRLWDPASGSALRRWKAHGDHVMSLAFSGDGRTLASGGADRRIRLWESATGNERPRTIGHTGPVKSVAFSPDGRVIASGGNSDCTIRFWAPTTGRELRRCDSVGYGAGEHWGVLGLAYASNGKTLISLEQQFRGSVFRLWDAAGAKQLAQFSHDKPNAVASFYSAVAFAPDNETVVGANRDGSIALWEPTQGKLLRYVGKTKQPLTAMALSPDGRRAAWVGERDQAGVRNLATGHDLLLTENRDVAPEGIAFSPDGFTIAAGDRHGPVSLWDAATGRLVAQWPEMTRIGHQGCVVFSPDGRFLAAGNDEGLALWEIAARQVARRLCSAREAPTALAFAPHGRTMVSAYRDGTLLVWDVMGITGDREPIRKWTDRELEDAWKDLTGENSAVAQRAIRLLAAAAPASLQHVKKLLKPVPHDRGTKIGQLISELDAETSVVRDQAMKELTRLGESAEPTLRRVLIDQRSIESQRRIERILGNLDQKALAVKWLHTQRALAILEYASGPEARQWLEQLAGGAPEARLTMSAQGALQRLANCPAQLARDPK